MTEFYFLLFFYFLTLQYCISDSFVLHTFLFFVYYALTRYFFSIDLCLIEG